jgi:hypothetical protein
MSDFFHEELASGRWHELSLIGQMGNIGSEVGRAAKWKEAGKADRAEAAACRALELFDLTLADPKNRTRLNEVARTRELFADFFFGDNTEAPSTRASWEKYFLPFAIAARQVS